MTTECYKNVKDDKKKKEDNCLEVILTLAEQGPAFTEQVTEQKTESRDENTWKGMPPCAKTR